MSQKLQPVRGTKDLLPVDYRQHHYVVDAARRVAGFYGFQEMATPIFEFTDVFKRTLGDTSDIVTKEMYTLESRGEESLTLRPEFTAGIARSFISNGLAQETPCKFFSHGPVFRYERPQKGRQRQFHQINFELIGIDSPLADIEIIALGNHVLRDLGLQDRITLELNSLGDKESRFKYRDALVTYLMQYKNDLSEDSQKRLETNPLRILDSKDQGDKDIIVDAPLLGDYYSDEAKAFFDHVQEGLGQLGIAFEINPKLVRGLDYYSHTAFEFTTTELGAQNAVLAGGRYDGLMAMMGGPETPAIGFAGGIERLVALLDRTIEAPRPIAIIPIGELAEKEALVMTQALRADGFSVDLGYKGNVQKRMKRANKLNARAAVIFGDDELSQAKVKVRDLDAGEEQDVNASQLLDILSQFS